MQGVRRYESGMRSKEISFIVDVVEAIVLNSL